MTLTTAKSFSLEIERIANEKGITHMEAVQIIVTNKASNLIP